MEQDLEPDPGTAGLADNLEGPLLSGKITTPRISVPKEFKGKHIEAHSSLFMLKQFHKNWTQEWHDDTVVTGVIVDTPKLSNKRRFVVEWTGPFPTNVTEDMLTGSLRDNKALKNLFRDAMLKHRNRDKTIG